MQTTEIEKLNARNAPSTWVPWVWLAGATLCLASLAIHDVFEEGGHAALHAACFTAYAVSGVAAHQYRVN